MESSIETHWTISQENNFLKQLYFICNSLAIQFSHLKFMHNLMVFSKGFDFLYLHISAQILPTIFLCVISSLLLSTENVILNA